MGRKKAEVKNADEQSAEAASAESLNVEETAPEIEATDRQHAPKGKRKAKGKGRHKKFAGKAADAVAAESEEAGPGAKLSDKKYAREMKKLHVELVKMQQWVVAKGLKVCIVFEGRDGAGKGGTIKAITERVSPRIFRVVALPAPTDREKTQMYMQRYLAHMPSGGEVVIFDRSWYNRAGVERVMGFTSEHTSKRFLEIVPILEKAFVESGIILIKYWLEVSADEQERRLRGRIDDGRKTWKLSPMDIKSFTRWDDYTAARDDMFAATDTNWAPWHVARSEDKKRVRLNVISHLLEHVPYEALPVEKVKLPKRKVGKVEASEHPVRYVPERF